MYCPNCGQINNDSANFCYFCGTKIQNILSPENPDVIMPTESLIQSESINDEEILGNEEVITEQMPEISFCVPEQEFYYYPGENAYATCIGINGNSYHFYCIDNLSHFYWTKQIVDIANPTMKIGDTVWVTLKELTDSKKYIYKAFSIKGNLIAELFNFYKYRKVGDTINAVISDVQQDCFYVQIGPIAKCKCLFSELPPHVSPTKIKPSTIKKFNITMLKNIDGKINIRLAINEEQFLQDKKNWTELPDCISDKSMVFIPPSILEYIKENNDVATKLFGDRALTIKNLADLLDEKYKIAYENKQISIQASKDILRMDFDLGVRDEKGVPQSAGFKKKKGDIWTMSLVGFSKAERTFEKYVYIPNWSKLLEELAEMALGDEDWDYNDSGKEKNYILRQYLLFDFYKSWLDDLIVTENGEALFNTGLVDSSYDDIYCYLKKNTCVDDFYNREWEFGYFACRAKGTNGKKLMAKFTNFPSAPSYVDVNRISDLYFNPDKELYCDYEHIIEDNLKRLPLNFLRSKLCYDSEMDKAINVYEKSHKNSDLQAIISLVNRRDDRGDRFRRDLQNGLKDAVETARKYCKWNYKTAIPIYYPRNNSISLLLPLNLQSNPNSQADVALVVERLQNGNYQGQTILTLEMAYQDARQICRPNSEWLTLNNILETDNEDDENDD